MKPFFHFTRLPVGRSWLSSALAGLLALCLITATLISACGGGVGSGGSGTGLASFAEGVVGGFGSVVVDDTEFNDTLASVQIASADGSRINTQAKLGQRVLVAYNSNNMATTIQVLPQLIGPASGAPDSSGWLKVADQWVQVVDTANTTASGPVTLVSGLTGLSAITAADELEVHGNWVLDRSLNAWVLMATRVEKLDTADTHVLVSGIVHSLLGNTQLRINSATGSLLQSSNLPTAIKAGQLVSAWVARRDWGMTPQPTIRLTQQGIGSVMAAGDDVQVSGLASDYDPVTNTVNVQGVRVNLPSGSGTAPASITTGAWVKVDGKGGALNLQTSSASAIQIQDKKSRLPVSLKGALSGIDWNANSVRFILRNSSVLASSSAIDKSCKSLASGVEAYVEVKGNITPPSTTVLASNVTCSTSSPSGATLQRSGTLVSVNTASLTLQTNQGLVQMQIDTNTYFEQPSVSLIGQPVDVEGVSITGSSLLRARVVRRAH